MCGSLGCGEGEGCSCATVTKKITIVDRDESASFKCYL